jgi:hypothetical protein
MTMTMTMTMTMDETQALSYVKAAAVALSLPLDEVRAQSVAGHLVLSAALARQLEAYALDVSDEPVEIYRPAPFVSTERAP